MRKYSKNVYRTALKNRGSLLGAILIIAIGIFVYVSMFDTLRNLQDQILGYYEDNALADVFASVRGIPVQQLKSMENLPGIEAASGRLSEDIRILTDGQEEIVTVHLLSYDEDETVNILRLNPAEAHPGAAGLPGFGGSIRASASANGSAMGDMAENAIFSESAGSSNPIYIGKRMSEIYGFAAGQEIRLLHGGSSMLFGYAGICDAPDYIYSIPPGGAMMSDGEVYDIACVSLSQAESLLGMHGVRNELGFRLKPGYEWENVRYSLENELRPYGLISLTSRADQVSYDMVHGEMNELISVGLILPILFMLISVFMTYVVHKKQIEKEHALIGTMKAFGMTDREMIGAYLLEGALTGLLGALAGGLPAGLLGKYMFNMYCDFFSLSDTVYHNYLSSRLVGVVIAVITGMVAALVSVRGITAIAPAQAMRAAAPKLRPRRHAREPRENRAVGPNRTALAENRNRIPVSADTDFGNQTGRRGRPGGLFRRMAFRTMARNPFRGMLMTLAVAFPFSMLPVLLSYPNLADTMFFDQFEKIQVYDLELSLDRWRDPLTVERAADGLPDITASEAIGITTAMLQSGGHTEYCALYALNPGSSLWRIKDNDGNYYTPPDDGILLNSRIAAKLHVGEGDWLSLSLPALLSGSTDVRIVSVIEEGFGSGCYLARDSLKRHFPISDCANTLLLRLAPSSLGSIKAALRNAAFVSWMSDARKTLRSYRDMMDSMIAMIRMFALLSVAAGVVLICSINMIGIRERRTELGTILIMGGSRRELHGMLLTEQLVYYLGGVLLGIPGSIGIKVLFEKILISENYSMTLRIGGVQYLQSLVICLLVTMAAWLSEMRFLKKINLTELLHERDG